LTCAIRANQQTSGATSEFEIHAAQDVDRLGIEAEEQTGYFDSGFSCWTGLLLSILHLETKL
jgi:hypothetical protein